MKANRLILLIALSIVLTFGSTAILIDPNSSAGSRCNYSNISIHSIQGAGHKSPIAGCYVSGIQGIVTLNTSFGFYIQDRHPDNSSSTSEGILVYTKNPPKNITKGDLAYVNGTVYEFQPNKNSLSLTEITNPTYSTTHSNSTITPIILGIGGLIPPNTIIEDDAFGDIAVNNSFDPNIDGIDFYESLEGMLVEINNPVAIEPYTPDKNRHAALFILGDNGSLADIRTPRGGVVLRPGDYNPERIVLDFFADSSDPINVGDTIKGPIIGAMDFSNNNYRIVVDKNTPLKVIHGNTTQEVPRDELTVATFNVLSLLPTSEENKYSMIEHQIIENLGAPDIIALEELMRDRSTNDGSEIYKTLNKLTQDIKTTSNGQIQYNNISIPDSNSDRNIAILYRTDRGLSFRGLSAGNPRMNVTVIGGPHFSPNPGWIYPRNAAFNNSRKPLAAEFTFKNQSLFIIANHLKAKDNKDTPLYGEIQPPKGGTEDQRHKQAQVVHVFAETVLNVDPKANVIVLGDLNDFQFSETLDILKGNILYNPMENLSIEEQYTTNFEGNSEAIDHILISENLLDMSPEIDIAHVNSDFANQASDHDPVALRIKFSADPKQV